jgi:hypothetical protein
MARLGTGSYRLSPSGIYKDLKCVVVIVVVLILVIILVGDDGITMELPHVVSK